MVRPMRGPREQMDRLRGSLAQVATPASANAVSAERSKKNGSSRHPRPPRTNGARYSNDAAAALVPYTDALSKPRTSKVRRPSPTV